MERTAETEKTASNRDGTDQLRKNKNTQWKETAKRRKERELAEKETTHQADAQAMKKKLE